MTLPDSPTAKPEASEFVRGSATGARPVNVQSVPSEQLLGVRGELKIQHNGELYSLRRTRQGKLILTK
jgi:hemin uptake protein HemP